MGSHYVLLISPLEEMAQILLQFEWCFENLTVGDLPFVSSGARRDIRGWFRSRAAYRGGKCHGQPIRTDRDLL
jgi:hypothetical protein